jgi:hypothetical protein
VFGYRGNVATSSSERWHVNDERTQALGEIGTKATFIDQCEKASARRAHEPEVAFSIPGGADGPVASLLDRPQQFRLRVMRQVSDLVEEYRAVISLIEIAAFVGDRVRECSSDMAEHHAFERTLWYGGHVDRYEGPLSATE